MDLQIIGRIFLICSVYLVLFSIAFIYYEKKEYYKYIIITSIFLTILFFFIRAYLKEFFPFTDKLESFSILFLFLSFYSLYYFKKLQKKEIILILFLSFFSGSTVFIFEDKINYPPPYLRTIWYPLHVPISFLAYTFWFIAGIKSIFSNSQIKENSIFINKLNKNAYILFTFSMIFGGIWGYLAWGAYFLWDPKLVWSLILWFFYGNLLHIDMIKTFKPYKRYFYIIGILLILITFIGTGFFSRSIHKF
ncbi:MAG: cytochrome c biogenesis protein CcsA [Spirochaetia bacterium]|nr:cytochrome c biogenesis protein CcsA [Spirochaetia bacterium]